MRVGNIGGALLAANMRLGMARGFQPSLISLLVASALIAIAAPVTYAQEVQIPFSIPAQPLDNALRAFSLQSKQQVLFDDATVAGQKSPAVTGSLLPSDALDRLLAGTGIMAVASRPGVYTLKPAAKGSPAAEATLGEVSVTASAERSATTEGTGSYTSRVMNTATKLNLSVRETPQSVSVITRQQMEDQGLIQLADVVKQTAGLAVNQPGNLGSDSSAIYSRGFAVENYQVDGVGQLYSNYNAIFQSNDMALYDRVEVVRGATGLMNGIGTPSATINMLRKRPTDHFQASAKIEAGSWDYYRAEADVSTPINEAGTVRGRIVAARQENGSYIDRLKESKKLFYGIVEADLTPSTLASAGFTFQQQDATGHARSGLPLFYSDGTLINWDRSASAAADWAYSKRETQSAFAALEHRFDNEWQVKGTLTHARSTFDEVLGYASAYGTSGFPDKTTGAGSGLWAGRWAGQPTQTSIDVYAGGPFTLLGRKHDLVMGATASYTKDDSESYNLWWFDNWDKSIGNIFTWNGSSPAAPNNPATGDWNYTERTSSAYASVNFKPMDALSVILGSRVTNWRTTKDTLEYSTGVAESTTRSESGELTPYAGVVLNLSKNWSVYGSYTNIFKPQSNKDTSGNYLDPLVGNSVEIGTKAAFFDDQLNLSAALYKIKQDNLAVSVAGVYAPDGSQAYRAESGTETRGFEVELAGRLARNWEASAGFARNLTQDKDGATLNTNIPQNTLKLFTSYRLPQIGNGLTVGGGMRWQSRIYSDNMGPANVRFAQGSYAVVDLMAKYALSKQMTASLNLYNVFDRKYYTSTSSAYYGEPLSARVGLSVAF